MGANIIYLIPILAIVMTIGAGMLKLYLNYQKRKDMFALYHQERMAAIEKGIELPPLPEDFFREDSHHPERMEAIEKAMELVTTPVARNTFGRTDTAVCWPDLVCRSAFHRDAHRLRRRRGAVWPDSVRHWCGLPDLLLHRGPEAGRGHGRGTEGQAGGGSPGEESADLNPAIHTRILRNLSRLFPQ